MAKGESHAERLDRELGELLQGLRVLLPGVQVLFAFLLTAPFSSRFAELTEPSNAIYLAALVTAAVASGLLVAPSALHRMLFRERDKEWMVVTSNRLAIAGTIFLAVSMSCALYFVAEFLYSSPVAAAVTALIAAAFVVLWYALPLARRARD